MVYRMFSGALDGQVTALNGNGAQITQIGTMKTEERQYGEIFNNKSLFYELFMDVACRVAHLMAWLTAPPRFLP